MKRPIPLTSDEIEAIKVIEAAALRLVGRTPADIAGTPEASALANSAANYIRRNRRLVPDRTR